MTLALVFLSPQISAQAACNDSQFESARSLVSQAELEAEPLQQSLLMMRAVQLCSRYEWWMSLGDLHARQAFWDASADAYSAARDLLESDAQGRMSVVDIERLAKANAYLADAHWNAGNKAHAITALEEAKTAYDVIGMPIPDSLLTLQGEIDDALTSSDASVLAESMTLQRSRSIRGIGIRPKIRPVAESDSPQPDSLPHRVAPNPVTPNPVTPNPVSPAVAESSSVGLTETAPSTTRTETVIDTAEKPSTQSTASQARITVQILFDTGSDQLAGASKQGISRIAEAIDQLSLTEQNRIQVIGHTDSRGPTDYNLDLSQRRARTVVRLLQDQTHTQARFMALGKGESELRYPGNTPADHRRNRRVELVIVD